jgi:predicted Zn-dependent peptidase
MAATTLIEEIRLTPRVSRSIRRTVLSNGLIVLTESMPHLRSISMGAWVGSGSRDEAPEVNGLSHFVEHMVFKGTTSRSARQIAREVDTIGGNLDAFTGKETVCFNIKVLDEHASQALDVLSDLVLHPTFTPEDLDREKGVILEEIKIDEDNPDYLVNEMFTQNFWKGDALGRPILGTKKTVSSFDQATLFDFYRNQFVPRNIVFAAAGNLEHESFVAEVERRFGSLAPGASLVLPRREPPTSNPHITLKRKKSLEQVQLCLGVPAPAVNHSDRYGIYLLNSILGGGMSSRLFQTIREDSGLAYSIFSEMCPFRDTGSLCIYAGVAVDKTRQTIELTMRELSRLKQEIVSEAELGRARDQLKSNMVMGLESGSSRMANLARQEMYFGRFFGIEEITREIEAVTPDDIQRLACQLFRPEAMAIALLGNLGEMNIEREDLVC